MTRRYTFPDTPTGAVRCTLALSAIVNRGNPPEGKRTSATDQRSEAKIVRALKAITRPIGAEPKRGELDTRARELQPGGGTLEIEQPEFKRLQEYIESMQWGPAITDEVSDFLDSLEADTEKSGE